MKNTFPIFNPDHKSFHWSLNNILLVLFLFFGFVSILDAGTVSAAAQKGMAAVFLGVLVMSVANLYRKKALKGTLEGTLTLNEDKIIISSETIAIPEIKRIFLRMNDYDGYSHFPRKVSLFPAISNGTNNLLDLDLKNGKKIKVFFKIEFQSQVQEVQPFIISLLKSELITQEKAMALLRLDNDYLINIFTEELNKKRA